MVALVLDIQVLEKVQQRATKCHWFEEQDLPTETEDSSRVFLLWNFDVKEI